MLARTHNLLDQWVLFHAAILVSERSALPSLATVQIFASGNRHSCINPVRGLVDATCMSMLWVGEGDDQPQAGKNFFHHAKRDRKTSRHLDSMACHRNSNKFRALLRLETVSLDEIRGGSDAIDDRADKSAVFPDSDFRQFAFWHGSAVVPLLDRVLCGFVRAPVEPKFRA